MRKKLYKNIWRRMLSRIILALDEIISREILKEILSKLYGIKIGYPLLLKLGINGVKDLVSNAIQERKEIILDLKLADIDNTMIGIVSQLDFADSFIAHSFIGIEGALDKLKAYLDEHGKKLYLLASMSHKGWNDNFYPYIREVIKTLDPYGIVAPATKTNVLKMIRKDFPNKVIISPGVGVQGGRFGEALCHGADYEIIGRSIYNSKDPVSAIEEIIRVQEEKLNECKRSDS